MMNDLRVSSLLIIDNDKLVGIVTDRDMRKVVANNTPVSTTVAEIMPKTGHAQLGHRCHRSHGAYGGTRYSPLTGRR